MEPSIRFVTSADGVRLAFSVIGAGPPLVLVRPWISHLELLWQDAAFRSFFERLAEQRTLVRYDGRGNGLSERDVTEVSFDDLVSDLETIVDHLELRDIALFGDAFGGPVAIAYVARHPDRVSHLILHGTYARGRDVATPQRASTFVSVIRDLPDAARLLLTHYTAPGSEDAPHRQVPMAEIIDAEVAAQLYSLAFEMDVSDLLPAINVPTLVLHRRGSMSFPYGVAREMASKIPTAELVPLEGKESNCWEGDGAPALRAIADFLGMETPVTATGDRPPLTILFTDLEGSTTLTQRVGDAQAQEVLRLHNTIVREALSAHGGSEIKHTGDGIMASFVSASRAVSCALAVQQRMESETEARPETPRVRIGLNAGEPVAEDDDLFGTAVQMARRICDQAQPGTVLVSDVVRQLTVGKGFLFSGQGETVLRGFDDPVRLYEVRHG
ncbi:MAG: adenylate/guanylate cyclase domain-containing protein [Dehalococcoidia bacterium]